jgi:hypothetical protein
MKGLRVIVGDEGGGPRSQLWRIWAGKGTSDVYVGARPIAGDVRVSLHESGKWRFAFTERHMRRPEPLIPTDINRAKHKWDRPPPFAPGLTRAFSIDIPASELRVPSRSDPLRKPALWLPPPPPDINVEIDLFLTRGLPDDEWPGRRAMKTQLLYRQGLPSGEELVVVSHWTPMTEERRARLDRYKQAFLLAQRDVLLERASDGRGDLKGVLFNVPGPDPTPDLQGLCSFTDVAIPRPRA